MFCLFQEANYERACTGAGERVGGMVNGTGLTLGSIAVSGASGDSRSVGSETRDNNELAEVGGFGK